MIGGKWGFAFGMGLLAWGTGMYAGHSGPGNAGDMIWEQPFGGWILILLGVALLGASIDRPKKD